MKYIFFAIIALSLVLTACSRGKEHIAESATTQIVADEAMKDIPDDVFMAPDTTAVTVSRHEDIIKTANLTLEVKAHDAYAAFVHAAVKQYGAYIFRDDHQATEYKNESNLVIKVPAAQFESLVQQLQQDAKLLQKSIQSEDVAAMVTDTRARLETRKATREKYLQFLKQATKVEDVLKIQKEINDIQEDIESAASRLAQLADQTKYSTINLTYFEPGAGYRDAQYKPGFGHRMLNAVREGGKFFADIFIGLLTLWPVWLIAVVVIVFVKRLRRKRFSAGKNS